MKRWFTLLSLIFVLVWSGCDFDPITNAVDDFNIVVELEDINTGFSIGVFDYETKEILDRDVTITFDSVSALQTIDIFSDPLPEETFDGGFINVGIRNEVIPTQDEPFFVNATIEVNGYLDQEISLSIVDTGSVAFNIDMIPEDNLPVGYAIDTFDAPVDAEGNALPLPLPIDTTTGEIIDDTFLSKLTSGTANVLFPKITVYDTTIAAVTWTLEDGSVFTGLPYGYQITSYIWNPKTPEFNKGYTLYSGGQGTNYRIVTELIDFKIKGPNSTNYSNVKSFEIAGRNPEAVNVFRLEFLAFSPDREDFWHDSYQANALSYGDFFNTAGIFSGRVDIELVPFPNDEIRQTVPFIQWFLTTNRSLPSEEITLLEFVSLLSMTTVNLPYFLSPTETDPISSKLILIGQNLSAISSHDNEDYRMYSEINKTNLTIQVNGFDDLELQASLKIDGIDYRPSFGGAIQRFNNVPMSTGILSVELPHTTYTQFIDLSNHSGETIEVTPPQPSATLVNATITADVRCKSPTTKELNISGFPLVNVAVRYRLVGDTDSYPRVGSIKRMIYDENEQVLKGVEINFPGVEVGQTYEFIFSVDAFSETTTQVIDSENFTVELEVRDSYCQDK